jgi:chromate transporter
MIFLSLFFTFLQIGAFGFGGGYGMLSLIQNETVVHHAWLTSNEFTNIVAISQMTPGPIGINSATYCGYTAVRNAGYGELMGILGSATATLALVLPSFVLMVFICRVFMKYINSQPVQSVLSGLRPTVVGLIGAAALLLMTPDNFSTPWQNPWQFGVSVALFVSAFVGTQVVKINPIRMILWAAFAGLMLLY